MNVVDTKKAAKKKGPNTITNKELLLMDTELQKIEGMAGVTHRSILCILLNFPINAFKKKFGVKIADINKKIQKINRAYFEIKDGQVEFVQPSKLTDGQGNQLDQSPKPKMLPGKEFDDFAKEIEALMQETHEIDF